MTAITIRKLPDDVKQKLRMRAAANQRSMEAEARAILVAGLEQPIRTDFTWIQQLVELGNELGGVEVLVPERTAARAVEL